MLNYQLEVEKRVKWLQKLVIQTNSKGIVLGISGGIDSAVVSVLCQKAVKDNFLGLILNIKDNCLNVSNEDILELLNKFKMNYRVIDLTNAFNSFKKTLNLNLDKLSIGNLKARLRMVTLYSLANHLGYLVAGTDNLSELITGYFTKYGDGASDFLIINDLVKSEVQELGKYLKIPTSIIQKKPSADLWEGQNDEEEMGVTYQEIELYIKHQLSPAKKSYQKIAKLYKNSAHKRSLAVCYKKINLDN